MDKIVLQDVVNNAPKQPAPPKQSFLSKERREERRFDTQQSLEYKVSGQGKSKKYIFLVALVLLLVGGFLFANSRSSAEVLVSPKRESASIDTNLKAYRNPEAPHLLGYEIVELSGETSASIPASGTKYAERKATGKISVSNTSSENVKIIANTRFKNPEGKIYRATSAFTIGAAKTIEISVVADAPGVEYNIGPSTFTLPGLAGGSLAEKVTGKSTDSMSGGFKGDMKIVSDDDLSKTRTSLEGALTQKLLDQVNNTIDKSKIFFSDAYSISFKFNENAQNGEASDASKQTVSLEGKIYAVVFDKKALASTIGKRELTDAGEDTIDIENWPDISLSLSSYDNLAESKDINVRVSGDAHFVWDVDKQKVASELSGIAKDAYPTVFLNYTSIDKAEVLIKPFWRGTFPKDPSRIHITIKPS